MSTVFAKTDHVIASTITSSGSAAGYSEQNVAIQNTVNSWRPSVIGDHVTMQLTAGSVSDYVMIYAPVIDGSIIVTNSVDGIAWSDPIVSYKPYTTKPIMVPIASTTNLYWRVTVDGTPDIAIISIGQSESLQIGLPLGWAVAYEDTSKDRTKGGELGVQRTLNQTGANRLTLRAITLQSIKDIWRPLFSSGRLIGFMSDSAEKSTTSLLYVEKLTTPRHTSALNYQWNLNVRVINQ